MRFEIGGLRFEVAIFNEQDLASVFIHLIKQVSISNEQLGTSIMHHEVESLRGVRGVERLVGTPCFEHSEGGYDHPLRTRDEDRDNILNAQSARLHIEGYAIAHLINLTIGVAMVMIHHSEVVGSLLDLLGKERHDGLGVVIRHISIIEAIEQRLLGAVEQGDRA